LAKSSLKKTLRQQDVFGSLPKPLW